MNKILAIAIACAISTPLYALSNSFSYQGSLQDGGSPANGSYDLQFQLQTSGGSNVGAPVVREDVNVIGGLFSVELDFGAAITSADFRLQIGVRPGASVGAYTTLSPTTNIRPTPQAQVAGIASEAVTVSPNAITGDSVANGSLTGVDIQDETIAGNDIQDNTIGAGDLINGSVGALSVNSNEVQLRVNNSCLAGSAIRAIGASGGVTCETLPSGGGGSVTSVGSGSGLTGGPITTSGTLSIANSGVSSLMIADGAVGNADLAANAVTGINIVDASVGSADINTAQVQTRVTGNCAVGSSIRDIAANGTVSCEADDGSVTSVASGAGLSGGPITTSGTLSIATNGVTSAMIADGGIGSADINTTEVQTRVTGTCPTGSSIRVIAANGTVSCETDDGGWGLSGNAGTNPASNFLGTTDAVDLQLRVNNQRVLLVESTISNLTSNWVAGYSGNQVDGLSGAQTIAGGGENETNCGLTGLVNANCDNRTAGSGSTVGGGIGQRATAPYATIAGGISNEAGSSAAVAGGARNQASGAGAAIPGGLDNTASGNGSFAAGDASCAGGDRSFALGQRARTRPGNEASDAACRGSVVPNSGDANGDEGSFVWADTQFSDFVSTGPNQFLLRADGGMGINTNSIGSFDDLVVASRAVTGDADADLVLRTRSGKSARIFVRDDTDGLVFNGTAQRFAIGTNTIDVNRWINTGANGAHLTVGGVWANGSSRHFKDVLSAVDPSTILEQVLALGITRWRYKNSDEGEHVGPMAEDFKAAFGLAGDGKSIATVDADGVALAAIQGLNQKLEAENAALRKEIDALRELVLQQIGKE